MRPGAGQPAPTRRQLLTGIGCSSLALGLGADQTQGASLSGTVFHDRTGSGVRRWGDPGIPGVLVSNGRDVVKTDTDGRWSLCAAEGDTIFVIKPPHWATPTRGCLPVFSHAYAPASAEKDSTVRAIRPGDADVDFALTPAPESACFEALLLADTQPATAVELAYLRDDIIASAAGQGAAFGICHGDVVFDQHALYPEYLQLLGKSGIPWHHCPGNHDIDYAARHDGRSRDTWKRVFGARHYAFQHAGALFIVLDNVYYFGCDASGNVGGYCGHIGEEQLRFVRNVLANLSQDTLVVLSMHIPLTTYQDVSSAADNTFDRRALLATLSGHPNCVSFSGHMHSTEHHYLGVDEGFNGTKPHHHHVLTAASGGWWGGPKDSRGIPSAESPDGNPNGFHVLSVDGGHYTTRFVSAPGKATSQMRLTLEGPCGKHADGAFTTTDAGNCAVVANLFDGGPRTGATCEIPGVLAPEPMARISRTDPFVATKPWACPVPSSHLWHIPLPRGLSRGRHNVIVRATDEYGRSHSAGLLLEVTEARPPA